MTEKLKMRSNDIVEENIDYIESRWPNAVMETKDEEGNIVKRVDFDVLKQELSNEVISEKQERYVMIWPDKKKAIVEANKSTNKTLRPVLEKSVDFENTKNIYIEGDNLETLKLLRETYYEKIKMIYIDPPYNTGNDFVYNDDFSQAADEYLKISGQFDNEGNRLIHNTESNGRFHTDWLNMMYPRLKLARDFLSEDGIIFISIDENEFVNLKKVCDEIYGENNFIENFIWIKNSTKNLSKTTSTNHEYIMCYAKNILEVENKQIFRQDKPGLKEVQDILEKANKENISEKETEFRLKEFFKSRPDLKGISMYDRVEKKYDEKSGQINYQLYTLSDLSAPMATGKASIYEVIHPFTGKPCKTPTRGWSFTKEKMEENIKNNLIYFYKDETKVPRFKRFLDTVTTEVFKSTFEDFTDGKKELMRLFDGRAPFENAKPTTLLKKLINLMENESIIMDFFSGSATCAEAVFDSNYSNSKNRKFILIQLPEVCLNKSEAFKMGYRTICDLGEERIRRAGKKIKEEAGLLGNNLDIGFRVLKLDSSNMKTIFYNSKEYNQENAISDSISNIKEDRNSLDLLFQVMLTLGIDLSSNIETKEIDNKMIYLVGDNYLIACFEENISEDLIKVIANFKPVYAIFRDACFNDDASNINCEQIIKSISPSTELKVL